MSEWTRYFHNRISDLEKHLFGPDAATQIAESAPANLPTDPAAPASADPVTAVTTPEGAVEPAPTGPVIGAPEPEPSAP